MNNEQLQAAKDQAARELYDCNYPQAILEGQLNTHTERENFLHRAMEIYAEWVMDKTVEDQKILLEATYTEGIREGFEAARLDDWTSYYFKICYKRELTLFDDFSRNNYNFLGINSK